MTSDEQMHPVAKVILIVVGVMAVVVAVSDVGRPYRATCYSAKPEPCFAVSALSGEYQAQGR